MHDSCEVLCVPHEDLNLTLVAIRDCGTDHVRVETIAGPVTPQQLFGDTELRRHVVKTWGLAGKTLHLSSAQIATFVANPVFKGPAKIMDIASMVALSKACAAEARALWASRATAPADAALAEATSHAGPEGEHDPFEPLPDFDDFRMFDDGDDDTPIALDSDALVQQAAETEPEDERRIAAPARTDQGKGTILGPLTLKLIERLLPQPRWSGPALTMLDDVASDPAAADVAEEPADDVQDGMWAGDPIAVTDAPTADSLAVERRQVDQDLDDLDSMLDGMTGYGSVASLSVDSLNEIVATYHHWMKAVAEGRTILGLKEWTMAEI